jgi:hypothetical protein
MKQRIFYSKRFYLAALILVACLLAVVSTVSTHRVGIAGQTDEISESDDDKGPVISQSPQKFDVFKYLPAGASLRNPDKDIVFADLDADGKNEVVIFYTIVKGQDHKANILVLKSSSAYYSTFWEDAYDRSSGFADPTGVYDLNSIGRPQIVTYRLIGASCPGVLDIYQYANGAIEKITGDWSGTCQSDLEIKDLDGDGIREIIFRRLKYGASRDIYRWNGTQYILSNVQFAQSYTGELDELLQNIYSGNPFPAPIRVNWCKQAVQTYLLQKRYSEAEDLCKALLQIIDDPNLTIPNSVINGRESSEQINRITMSLDIDRINGKAAVNHLLGDIHKARGDLKLSQRHYKVAQTLEREARDKMPGLWR